MIATFGSVESILSWSRDRIERTLATSPTAASHLLALIGLVEQVLRIPVEDRPVFSSLAHVHDYLRATMAHATVEQIRVLYLTASNRLIVDEVMLSGSINSALVPTRDLIRRALEVGAAGLLLVHNHPSGDPKPSEADRQATARLKQLARELDIALHDHVIVARSGTTSFRTLGLM